MDDPFNCVLLFAPDKQYVNAQIVTLDEHQIRTGITNRWWTENCLIADHDMNPRPIDHQWNWTEVEISWDGQILNSEKVGVITGDGYVQGAMLISTEGVKSELELGQGCLFVELLFTAPQNRSTLRTDGVKYFSGVGPELLRWAAIFSRERGFGGRLRLDASPDYLKWYEGLGFVDLGIELVTFEGVQYTPMELPIAAVERFVSRTTDRKRKKEIKR